MKHANPYPSSAHTFIEKAFTTFFTTSTTNESDSQPRRVLQALTATKLIISRRDSCLQQSSTLLVRNHMNLSKPLTQSAATPLALDSTPTSHYFRPCSWHIEPPLHHFTLHDLNRVRLLQAPSSPTPSQPRSSQFEAALMFLRSTWARFTTSRSEIRLCYVGPDRLCDQSRSAASIVRCATLPCFDLPFPRGTSITREDLGQLTFHFCCGERDSTNVNKLVCSWICHSFDYTW